MKHIPIMLALALSINLMSYDGNTTTNTNYIHDTEATSIEMSSVNLEELNKNLAEKSDVKL